MMFEQVVRAMYLMPENPVQSLVFMELHLGGQGSAELLSPSCCTMPDGSITSTDNPQILVTLESGSMYLIEGSKVVWRQGEDNIGVAHLTDFLANGYVIDHERKETGLLILSKKISE